MLESAEPNDSHPWIDTLPDELLVWIIRLLSTDDRRGLCSLNIANRRFHRLSGEHLYNQLSFDYADPNLFFRTLATSPGLATYVKIINWGYGNDSNEGYNVPSWALSDTDKQLIASRLTSYGTPDNYIYSALFPELKGRETLRENFLYAVLLCTPRVKNLLVADSRSFSPNSYWFKPLSAHPELFAHLQSVSLRGPLNIENIVPLLKLPSLRQLDLTEVISQGNVLAAWGVTYEWMLEGHGVKDVLEEGSRLEHLRIRDSSVDFQPLPILFQSMKSLMFFEYRHLCNVRTTASRPKKGILFSAADALASRGQSLECLNLHDYYALEDSEIQLLLLALNDFERLRSLTLGPLFALSPSSYTRLVRPETFLKYFPQQIEHLRIRPFEDSFNREVEPQKCLENVASFLTSLAALAKAACPALRSVTIVEWNPIIGKFSHEFPGVEGVFINAGLDFHVEMVEMSLQDLVCLEDVEEGWLWVQMMDLRNRRWLSTHHVFTSEERRARIFA